MKCKLIFSDGRETDGEFRRDGEDFAVDYLLDGDKCVLEYNGGCLTQSRRGSVVLKLDFIPDRESECVIGEGELRGTLPVFCEKLDIENNGGVEISLEYLLGGERMSLGINIVL